MEALIDNLNERLTEAKADLFHLAVASHLFDPGAVGGTATAWNVVPEASKRSDIVALCASVLEIVALIPDLVSMQLAIPRRDQKSIEARSSPYEAIRLRSSQVTRDAATSDP